MENYKVLLPEFEKELNNILSWWGTFTPDREEGGFYGELNNDNEVIAGAVKGAVLNARILWSFSAAYNLTQDPGYLDPASRACMYIRDHFIDKDFGGVYWSVDAKGAPIDLKKQIYAIAFTIYGLTEYHRARPDKKVLELAKKLYEDIEGHSYDPLKGGYLEAFTREWAPVEDLRLSAKDANEKKTMNTHLHILEAYTNLYRVWQDEGLNKKIRLLLQVFEEHIVDPATHHLILFFDEDWTVRSAIDSYGHDIEASWLLVEAAEILEDEPLLHRTREMALKIAAASAEGLNADGSMSYELDRAQGHLIAERHWWVQAEAMVGFFNAGQMTGEEHYYRKFRAVWEYTRSSIIDRDKGEWFWGRHADGSLMAGQDKAGFWKCPYHNSRACIEIIRRLRASAQA